MLENMPRVKLFANFREITGRSELEVDGNSVEEILNKLAKQYPKLKDLFFEGGKLREYVNIMVNGKNIRGDLDYQVKKDDVIAIFPPVSGG